MHTDDLEELVGDGGNNHSSPKDLMFDQWATLTGGDLKACSDDIARQVLEALRPTGRKPRADLVKGIGDIVPTLIANLLVLHRDRPDGSRLVIPMERRKKTRYDRSGFRKLPEVVNALEHAGHVIKHDAIYKQRRTTLEATGHLKQVLGSPSISLACVARAEGEETIHLTARPATQWIGGKRQPNSLVDYEDSVASLRLKGEMDGINSFLASHSIELEDEPKAAFRLYRRFSLRSADDPRHFALHGRLYGGFWMTLRASERHRIRIDGEPIADLDFSSMFPRLAYREVGHAPPEGDLYAVPGLEGHRDGAKAGLSALLSYGTEMKSLPSRLKQHLPEGWTARRLRQAFANHHPHLVQCFERDFGLDLMFTESRILLAAMRRLMVKGIPALPMHDGIMVPSSKADIGMEAMEKAAAEVTGSGLPVSRKD